MCSLCDDGDVAPRLPLTKPKFSWQVGREKVHLTRTDVRPSTNPADYEARDLVDTTWVRRPGEVNDQRVTIEDCRGCFIAIMDQCDSIQVDHCQDCRFYFGPTTGSVFIRDSKDCAAVVACGQLRLRDVKSCRFALYCQSRPVLESSSHISIGCFSPHHQYFELLEHAYRAKMSLFNNLYSDVHDFTPQGGNVSIVAPDAIPRDILPHLPIEMTDISMTESAALYEGAVVFPFVYGTQTPPASLPTVGVVGLYPGKVDTAMALVTEVELARRRNIAGSPLLLNALEHHFTSESVAMLKPHVGAHAKAIAPLTGNVGIFIALLFFGSEAANTYFAALKGKSDGSVLLTIVGTHASTHDLCDVLFAKLPIQGLAFGTAH